MFVGILLRDPARDFGVEFESLRHREIFEISARADKKLYGATLNHPVPYVFYPSVLMTQHFKLRTANVCNHTHLNSVLSLC